MKNLVFGIANCHSAIMSLFELGTSRPNIGHVGKEICRLFS
jgi:hypothetical protein